MKIDVDGEIYDIRFHYDPEFGLTEALVNNCIGYTECSKYDQYNKKIGRKIALARALENGGFPKDVRTKIWTVLIEKGMRLF